MDLFNFHLPKSRTHQLVGECASKKQLKVFTLLSHQQWHSSPLPLPCIYLGHLVSLLGKTAPPKRMDNTILNSLYMQHMHALIYQAIHSLAPRSSIWIHWHNEKTITHTYTQPGPMKRTVLLDGDAECG